jgi:translocation and assembly module TamA
LTLGADLALTSHDFELYRTSPRYGYEFTMGGNFSRRGWLGELTAQSIRVGLHRLWNLGNFEPPLFVLGVRGSFATTITPSDERANLPLSLRHRLGGSQDLRGFGFQEIPSTSGALTAIYLSTELRLGYWLPWGLQPLAFLDIGKTGSDPMKLDQPWVYSPGLGLRWESPIGAFRASAAQGFVSGTPPAGYSAKSHFQLFISYGEEF